MASQSFKSGLKRSALTVALGLCFAGGVHAQSTTGTLFGSATPGDTVTVVSETGFTRTVAVDSSGRYTIANLPAGDYTVTLKKGEAVAGTRQTTLRVGSGTEVSFGGATGNAGTNELNAITVTGNGAGIDVTQVDSRVVITAKDLKVLPVAHSAEAIALLAPGAVQGASTVASPDGRSVSTVSFGGAGITENAYYINGYNSTDPLGGLGGAGLPYGSIAQQETYIGGYSAMYGRSDGGVISQIGKRGTNDWHFGGQVRYAPRSMQADSKDIYFPRTTMPPAQAGGTFDYSDPSLPGKIYYKSKLESYQQMTYDAYVGGPLVPNKLFFFLSTEQSRTTSVSPSTYTGAPQTSHATNQAPKFYGKLDWNITDSNILEFSWIKNKSNTYRDLYSYDFASGAEGAYLTNGSTSKYSVDVLTGKYTSYLSDDITLSVLYGKSIVHNPFLPANNPPDQAFISSATRQDPLITGGIPRRNAQKNTTGASNSGKVYTDGLRVDVSWRLGDHTVSGGIDNMHYAMYDQGLVTYGPGYLWIYGKAAVPTAPLNPSLGVGAPGGRGYYVQRYIFRSATSSKVDQTAYYLEDAWQITDNFLLKAGLRNDHFVNRNNLGQPYVDEKNQWAPRIGFSWDINGDSSAKLYGNVGRYYLALPPSVAIRGASASTYTREYFDYTGIDAQGNPTGLTALGPGPVSSNHEYGTPVDPNTVAAVGLKAQYQDEFILGFDKQLGAKWSAGVKGTVRNLRAAIDDYCDYDTLAANMVAQGYNPDLYDIQGCYIFNPGRTNTFHINRADGTGYALVSMTNGQLGFTEGPKRRYVGLDLYLDHAFDGKWSGRVDYTWSRSTGNTEGQVKSDTGQGDTSKTSDWDYGQLMEYASGTLQNDRTHQLKLRGAYQFLPEWMLTGTASFMSGRPKNCLGYYGTNEGNPGPGYGDYYHWCGGQPARPGSAGRTPWTKQVNLGLIYTPLWAQKKLSFGVDVFNVFNSRVATAVDPNFEDSPYTISNTYGMGVSFQTPRRVVFSMSYDY